MSQNILPGATIATYLIPLNNVPTTFPIVLGSITYNFTSKYNNAPLAGWVLDIADSSNNPIATNIPMITGANMLGQLGYLGIGGEITGLYIYNGTSPTAVPTLNGTSSDLGVDCNLYFQVITNP